MYKWLHKGRAGRGNAYRIVCLIFNRYLSPHGNVHMKVLRHYVVLSDRLYLSLSIVPAFVQEIRACEVEVVSLLSNHIQ